MKPSTFDILNKQLSEIDNTTLFEMGYSEITKLCKTGGRSFTMSVPVNIKDTDIILTEIINRFKEYLKSKN
jgi:hypothetical protein